MSSHRVVVVGGGFGGLQAVRRLRREPVEITLVDRRNFHLFQPLVYQVATGALSPGEIASPLRGIFKRDENVRVLLGEVTGFDLAGAARAASSALPNGDAERAVPYDSLIVAGGSSYSYFGHDEWRPFAPDVKSLESALEVRRRILTAFEAAEVEEDPETRAPPGSRSSSSARGQRASSWPGRSPRSRATRCAATSARSTRARRGSCSSRRPTAS